MIRLALAQMRRSLPRLVSAGIAILIGTAFVAATLVAGNVITRTSYDAIAASLADADLVVLADQIADDDVAALRQVEGVAAADGQIDLWTELNAGSERAYPPVTVRASDPSLEAQTVTAGVLPAASGEVALPEPLADRLDVGVGDQVTAVRQVWDAETGDATDASEQLTVVGLTDDPSGAFAQSEGAVVAVAEDAARWWAQDTDGATPTYRTALVALTDGADVETVRAAIADTLAEPLPGASVVTKQERAEYLAAQATGDADALTGIVLGFAAVALLVAALVVANTFQVLVAQRTRTLALLRCVGAEKRQIRRSVLVEAALLGVASSAAGLAAGLLLAQGTLVVLGNANPDVPLPGAVPVTPAVVLVPLLVGTLVTLVAALSPARAATRVAPLEALRPAEQAVGGRRAGRARVVLASLLVLGGAGLLVLGVAVSGDEGGVMVGLPIGILGGTLSFVGVVVGAVLWIPRVVSLAGGLLGSTGPSARLAAANTLRNPRRTSATSAALLIGVTLVAMMSTGAASSRATLGKELASQFPVDVLVADPNVSLDGPTDAEPALTTGVADRLEGVEGVAGAGLLTTVWTAWGDEAGDLGWQEVRSMPADEAAQLVRAPEQVAGLSDDTVVIGLDAASPAGIEDGAQITLHIDGGEPVVRTAVVTEFPGGLLVTPGTMTAMGVDLPANEIWLRLADDADTVATMDDVQSLLSEVPVQVMGAALERAAFEDIVDTLLAVVLGLLAAAVVIALIGVANTLSLSVIERRRESATLRAIGLSRGQLRASLALEGCLIAGVGAVLGIGLGLAYGWTGSMTVLRAMGEVSLEVPWRDLGVALVVAIVAGLLASVLPARSAARTSPVEALAVE